MLRGKICSLFMLSKHLCNKPTKTEKLYFTLQPQYLSVTFYDHDCTTYGSTDSDASRPTRNVFCVGIYISYYHQVLSNNSIKEKSLSLTSVCYRRASKVSSKHCPSLHTQRHNFG